MVHFILVIIAIILTILFFLFSSYVLKRSSTVVEKKAPGILQQIIIKIIFIGIFLEMFFSIPQIRNFVFIKSQNGYDMEAIGNNLFVSITTCALVVIIGFLFACCEYILFPQYAITKNSKKFHSGFKLRIKLMTILFFISITFILFNMLNGTYYKKGGEIIVSDQFGFNKTHYFSDDIKDVVIFSYKDDYLFIQTNLIITFSDGRVLVTDEDSAGSKKFLSEWKGEVIKHIKNNDFYSFPPRLLKPPIFYAVSNY